MQVGTGTEFTRTLLSLASYKWLTDQIASLQKKFWSNFPKLPASLCCSWRSLQAHRTPETTLRCCQGLRTLMDYVSQSLLYSVRRQHIWGIQVFLLLFVSIVLSVWAGDWVLIWEALMKWELSFSLEWHTNTFFRGFPTDKSILRAVVTQSYKSYKINPTKFIRGLTMKILPREENINC